MVPGTTPATAGVAKITVASTVVQVLSENAANTYGVPAARPVSVALAETCGDEQVPPRGRICL